MTKATTTIRQALNHKPDHGARFAANQALFNQVAAFYFEVIQAHRQVLELGNQEAMRALEQLTHATDKNPHPVMLLSAPLARSSPIWRSGALAVRKQRQKARSFMSVLPFLLTPGTSPSPSMLACGRNAPRVASSSKSGPERAGVGSSFVPSVESCPMALRLQVPHWSGVVISGGSILL
jgi:hypothetical protein